MRTFVNTLICIFSAIFSAFGIMSLLYVANIYQLSFLSFYSKFGNLILQYVVVIVSMASGIMLFNLFASRLKCLPRTILSIGVTVYSTVLTLPLLLTFVLCFASMFGLQLNGFLNDFVAPIASAFESIFKQATWRYVIYAGGIVMSIIFIAVPIAMCVKLNATSGKVKDKKFIRV